MMNVKGLFHGQYSIDTHAPHADLTRDQQRAFVVPGQGSAFPGMFNDQLATQPIFRERFAQADQWSSGFDLLPISLYIKRPAALPSDKLHIYRNCAIFAAEVAMGEYVIEQGLEPSVITAHSFGECAAMVLSGLIDYATMFQVVAYRNILAPPANDLGFMVALGGDPEKILDLQKIPGVYLANRNSPRQIVLSVAAASRSIVIETIKKQRLPHVLLTQLPQPYHSPLMEDFRLLLKKQIASIKFSAQPPRYPLFSCVSHSWIDRDNYKQVDLVDLLSRQATEPIDFVEQIQALVAKNVSRFYEIGPGRMLESSIRAVMLEQKIAHAYKDTETLILGLGLHEKAKEVSSEHLVRSPWFEKIKTAIQVVAGYKSDDIDITHSFQNDLGIDSIKKAEIFFKLINEGNLSAAPDFSISQFSTIVAAVDYLENYSDSSDPLRSSHSPEISLQSADWIQVDEPKRPGLELESESCRVLRLSPVLQPDGEADLVFLDQLTEFARITRAAGQKPVVIFDMTDQDYDPERFLLSFHRRYALWLARGDAPQISLAIIDRSQTEQHRPFATIWKSVRKELGGLRISYLQSDRDVTDAEVVLEFIQSTPRDLLYKGGRRFVRDYFDFKPASRYARSKSATVVSIGGSSGINLEVLKNFPVVPGDKLILIGRRHRNDKTVSKNLDLLEKHWPSFTYVNADAEKYGELSTQLKSALSPNEKIDILFNSCGYEVSKNFDEKDRPDVQKEFASKWTTFKNIERLKPEFSVEKVIHYSSLVTEFGNSGQIVYSFSNSLIERECRKSGSFAIAWGPWENVGMTENQGIRARLKDWGLSCVSPDEGVALTYRLLFGTKQMPPVTFGFDAKDIFLFTSERSKLQDKNQIIGTIQNGFAATFNKDIDVKTEPFLADHYLEGKPWVAASYFMATILSVGKAQFGRTVGLSNFEIQNPIILNDGFAQAKVQAFFRSPHHVSIYSVVPHCSAQLNRLNEWTEPTAADFVPAQTIDVRDFSKNWAMKTGPHYQVITVAELDATNRVRLLVDTQSFKKLTGELYFDFIANLLEVALQSVTVQANIDRQSVTIPQWCRKIVFAPDCHFTRHLKIRPRILKDETKFWLSDIDIQNDQGKTICRLIEMKSPLHPVENPDAIKF